VETGVFILERLDFAVQSGVLLLRVSQILLCLGQAFVLGLDFTLMLISVLLDLFILGQQVLLDGRHLRTELVLAFCFLLDLQLEVAFKLGKSSNFILALLLLRLEVLNFSFSLCNRRIQLLLLVFSLLGKVFLFALHESKRECLVSQISHKLINFLSLLLGLLLGFNSR